MASPLPLTRAPRSRLEEVDWNDLGFGRHFSDHMVSMRWRDGRWDDAEVIPYGPLAIEPGNAALHYGQTVFEGLKVFRGVDGRIRAFRPDANERRLQASCRRMCIPPPPDGSLATALEALVAVDHPWIPRRRGESLYVRPLIIGEESHLEVRPSRSFRMLVMSSPVRSYFATGQAGVSLKVDEEHTRSAPGGVGFAKTGGNYAASFLPAEIARREGFDQVLWLDGVEHRNIEEVGQMNIFFRLDDRVVTPPLRGTILPGVTRDSVLTLLHERGVEVAEEPIAIDSLVRAMEEGRVQEAFGAGTAAVIAPVGCIGVRGRRYDLPVGESGSLSGDLFETLTGIQFGERADAHGWMLELPPAEGLQPESSVQPALGASV